MALSVQYLSCLPRKQDTASGDTGSNPDSPAHWLGSLSNDLSFLSLSKVHKQPSSHTGVVVRIEVLIGKPGGEVSVESVVKVSPFLQSKYLKTSIVYSQRLPIFLLSLSLK